MSPEAHWRQLIGLASDDLLIADRYYENGHVFKFEARSYRLKEAAVRLANRGGSD